LIVVSHCNSSCDCICVLGRGLNAGGSGMVHSTSFKPFASTPPPQPLHPRDLYSGGASVGVWLQGYSGSSCYAVPERTAGGLATWSTDVDSAAVPELSRDGLRFVEQLGEGPHGEVSCVSFLPPERSAMATWLSVCVSDTLMYCAQTTESIIMRPSPDCSPAILVFSVRNMNPIGRGNPPQ